MQMVGLLHIVVSCSGGIVTGFWSRGICTILGNAIAYDMMVPDIGVISHGGAAVILFEIKI